MVWLALTVSILSLVLSGFVFGWNVLQERMQRAPFLWCDLKIVQGPKSNFYTFTVTTTNSGANPAKHLEGEVVFAIDCDLEGTQQLNGPDFRFSNANALPSGASFAIASSQPVAIVPRRWVRVKVRFTDALTKRRDAATYGFIWGGTEDNKLAPLSSSQLDKLDHYLETRPDDEGRILRLAQS